MASTRRSEQLLILITFLLTSVMSVLSEDEEKIVTTKPYVTGPGKNIVGDEGDELIIDCGIQDVGVLPLTWEFQSGHTKKINYIGSFRYSNIVENEESSSQGLRLTIKNISRDQAGNYTCKVQDALQRHNVKVRWTRITITPVTENKVLTENEVLTYKSGSKVEIICSAEAVPPPSLITWSFKNKKLSEEMLIIPSVTVNDAGKYTCTVTKEKGKPKQRSIELVVLHKPIIVDEKEHRTAMKGTTVEFSCKHTATPPATISWSKMKDPREFDVNSINLTLKNVTEKDAGSYVCVLKNDIGTTKKEFHLEVNYPPQISTTRNWVHTGVGSTIDIECTVIANPPTEVLWLHNETQLQQSSNKIFNKKGDKSILRIRNFKYNDFGNYTCWAENSIGMNSLAIILTGLANPVEITVTKVKTNEAKVSYTTQSRTPIFMFDLHYRNLPQEEDNKDSKWINVTIPAEKSDYYYQNYYILKDLDPVTNYEIVMRAINMYGWNHLSDSYNFSLANSAPANDTHSTSTSQQTEEISSSSIGDQSSATNEGYTTTQGNDSSASLPTLVLIIFSVIAVVGLSIS